MIFAWTGKFRRVCKPGNNLWHNHFDPNYITRTLFYKKKNKIKKGETLNDENDLKQRRKSCPL